MCNWYDEEADTDRLANWADDETTSEPYLLLESAIPAKALYQARNAARIPNPPPALMAVPFGAPLEWSRYPIPRQRKARSRVKKSEKNATVDFRVQRRSKKVKMNQP
jgi:hypothetical protein